MELKNSKMPIVVNILVLLTILMLLNAIVIPAIVKRQISEVDYGTFLEMIENDKVESVQIEETQISFIGINESGKKQAYVTGRMEDPNLAERLYKSDVKSFGSSIPEEISPLFEFFLTWVLPFAILFVIGKVFTNKMLNKIGGKENAMSFGKSNAKIYVEAQTGISFDDVAGQDEAKEALQEVVDFLHNPKKYSEIGAKIPKGVLLVGPPGTGKTLIARAIAGESKVPFFSISGSEFVEMFVGMGAARVRDLFKQAQEKAPCIVFIDEIDTIGKSRDASMGGNDEREQTLNQLLTEMDGFNAESGVVLLAATNRPEVLDKALLRPGRFDRRVPVELPDLAGREAILKVHAKNVKLGTNIELNTIAKTTPGASGADLANIINEGALRAIKLGRTYVTQEDLEESVEVVIAGYQRKNAVISMKDKLTVSYHEIGHAIVATKQTNSAPVQKITIIPRTSGALGYTMQVEDTEQILLSKEQTLSRITTYMGGRAAEEIIFETVTSGASNDIEQATKIARAMVTKFGMSDKFGMMALETSNNPYLSNDSTLLVSADTASKIDEEVHSILESCHKKALEILRENIDKLNELAKYLLEKETISGEDFMRILSSENTNNLTEAN